MKRSQDQPAEPSISTGAPGGSSSGSATGSAPAPPTTNYAKRMARIAAPAASGHEMGLRHARSALVTAPPRGCAVPRPSLMSQATTNRRASPFAAAAAATLLGARSPLLNPLAPPRPPATKHPAVAHYAGVPLPDPPAEPSRRAAAPAPRMVRTSGVKQQDAKRGDPNTPDLSQLVDDPVGFYFADRDNDGGYTFWKNKGGVSSLWAELGASNPSLLMSCGKVVVGGTMVFNGDSPTSTGFYHNGHSEWKHRIYDSAPNFREVLARMQPVMEELTLLNATGESTWLSTHNSILFGAIDNMSPTQVAQYAASLFAANGAVNLKIDEDKRTCKPAITITLGRDAPGALAELHKKLFGSLVSETSNTSPGVPGGEYSKIEFNSVEDQLKFFKLVNGEAVDLACGHVPATPSGLPRCAGKLLKLRTILEYTQAHRKREHSGGGRRPSRFTTLLEYNRWWTDANNWRQMHEELHPGVPVPDWEH
ncbi:hypothetical protein C2E21_0286 [Chlorella sorokiniana]|uniref:Uncharacterized protein n=1 Tax=Chlorella sorokiniana TaxID=3076 RepID=A0A2P6U4Y7_CHLSO|nr:hypothetical protein C2E21_0286 [Chlorella sorokiniana]|eukprot:PRW61383.1 hypothetical protein C2E21_0286 [Chlorella sorokiniana]